MEDLSHRGRRYGDAEFRQLAMDPAVSPGVQLVLAVTLAGSRIKIR